MRVTALLAHADDELMCAGTLARFAAEGDEVTLVTVFPERPDDLYRAAEAINPALKVVWGAKLNEVTFGWGKKSVTVLEEVVGDCDLLISHRVNDANTSHGHLGQVARTLCRKNRRSLWEIDQTLPGGLTDHSQPNLTVDISAYTANKAAAVAAYESILDRWPSLDVILAMRDRLLGWSSGVAAAEGFTVVRSVL